MVVPFDNSGLEMIELHDARLRSLRWTWDSVALVDITEAYLYVRASDGDGVEPISYDIHNADIHLICEGVRKLSAEEGAFSRHDSIYSAEVTFETRALDLADVLAGAAADAVDMTFFPTGSLAISCKVLRCRVVSELVKVGRWPGGLDDPNIRAKFF